MQLSGRAVEALNGRDWHMGFLRHQLIGHLMTFAPDPCSAPPVLIAAHLASLVGHSTMHHHHTDMVNEEGTTKIMDNGHHSASTSELCFPASAGMSFWGLFRHPFLVFLFCTVFLMLLCSFHSAVSSCVARGPTPESSTMDPKTSWPLNVHAFLLHHLAWPMHPVY